VKENISEIESSILRGENSSRDLVKQWLELLIVVLVDQSDPQVRSG
jgi:hypothetical protein